MALMSACFASALEVRILGDSRDDLFAAGFFVDLGTIKY